MLADTFLTVALETVTDLKVLPVLNARTGATGMTKEAVTAAIVIFSKLKMKLQNICLRTTLAKASYLCFSSILDQEGAFPPSGLSYRHYRAV